MGLSLRSRARGARSAGPMSKFVEALEHAERERVLGQRLDGSSLTAPAAARVAEVSAALEPVRDAELPVGSPLDEHLVGLLKPTSVEAEQYPGLVDPVEQLAPP